MNTIRFWTHCPGNCDGGFVKLTLRPGQRLSWGFCCETEEGWHSRFEGWTYDDSQELLVHHISSDGVDCDGRLSRGSVLVCPVGEIAAEAPNDYCQEHYDCKGVMLPAWREENAWQRDFAAEAAGY
jgi:hypothetical protein